jgi:cytochrome c553
MQGFTGGDAIANLAHGGAMFKLKAIVPAAILLGGFLVSTTASFGKQEYMKTTKKACVYCHAKVSADKDEMNKNLTAPGKYYHEHKSLDGYQEKK